MRTPTASLLVLSLFPACENPAANKPKARVGEAQPEAAAAAGEQVLTLDTAASKLEFVGAKVTKSEPGGFKTFTGNVRLIGDDPTKSTISIEVDTGSVYTTSDKLTAHLKSPDFFDVAKFPKASFVSTRIEPGPNGTYQVTGNLDLHGVKKAVTFPAKIAITPAEVSADAEFAINRKDWGIVYPGMPDDLIRDEVVVKFSVRAPKTKSS